MKVLTITDVENAITYTFENSKADGGLINQVEGFEYPSALVSVEDIANNGGAIEVNSKFGRRTCSFVYRLTCDVLVGRRSILAALRQTGYLKLVKFTTLDDLDLQFYAYITQVLAPYTSMQKPILIGMVAPDWRFFDQTLQTESINPAATETLTNDGNEQTNPIMRVYGPFSTATVTNLNNSETFTLSDAVTNGHWVEIDTQAHTVITDLGASAYGSWSGDFMRLVPGDNDIMFTATGASGVCRLEVDWRDAYNGI